MDTRKARLKIRVGRKWEFRDIEIPTDDEIERLAERMHSARKDFREMVGEWNVSYTPSRPFKHAVRQHDIINVMSGRSHGEERPWNEVHGFTISVFEIGYGEWLNLHWSITASWTKGDDQPPYWNRQLGNIIPPIGERQGSLFPDTPEPEPEEIDPELRIFEGTSYHIEETAYERNSEARRRCIAHYGARCQACVFDFGARYGPVAEGFIHVHHVVPISAIGEEYAVDPITDLVPLCPNCHAVAHLRTPPFSVEELKTFLRGGFRP